MGEGGDEQGQGSRLVCTLVFHRIRPWALCWSVCLREWAGEEQGHRVVALCDDNTARFIDVGQRRLIKAVARPGLGLPLSLSLASHPAGRLRMLPALLCLPSRLVGEERPRLRVAYRPCTGVDVRTRVAVGSPMPLGQAAWRPDGARLGGNVTTTCGAILHFVTPFCNGLTRGMWRRVALGCQDGAAH